MITREQKDREMMRHRRAKGGDRGGGQYLPRRKYHHNDSLVERERIRIESELFAVIAILGVLSGLLFLSQNITGNVTASLSQNSNNFIGIILLIAGLVGAFAYFRRR